MKYTKFVALLLLLISQFSHAEVQRRITSYFTGQQVLDDFSTSEHNIEGLFTGNAGRCTTTLMKNDDSTYGVFIFQSGDKAYQVSLISNENYTVIKEHLNDGSSEYTIRTEHTH